MDIFMKHWEWWAQFIRPLRSDFVTIINWRNVPFLFLIQGYLFDFLLCHCNVNTTEWGQTAADISIFDSFFLFLFFSFSSSLIVNSSMFFVLSEWKEMDNGLIQINTKLRDFAFDTVSSFTNIILLAFYNFFK